MKMRIVVWDPCMDRRTKGFENLLPELTKRGSCNSSHGGSCCVCNGPLPDLHIHLNAEGDGDIEDMGMGGNVCSEGCVGLFLQWMQTGPNVLEICPGHWQISNKFNNWPHRQKRAMQLVKAERKALP